MKALPEMNEVALSMQKSLEQRFQKYTDPAHDQYNPLFLMATSLDLRYQVVLNDVQVTSAKKHILAELKTMVEESGSSESESSQAAHDITVEVTPPAKRFRHLEGFIQQKMQTHMRKSSKLPPGGAEVERYFASFSSVESTVNASDPLEYWARQESQYPLIAKLAVGPLSMPSSLAPVERVFSTAGESCIGKRNRLTDVNLEREVMLKKNKHYL